MNDNTLFVENSYRVFTDRQRSAIAGFSMGGEQAQMITVLDLTDYSLNGVFGFGLFELGGMNLGDGNDSGSSRENATYQNA